MLTKQITRQKFLQQCSVIGAGAMLAPFASSANDFLTDKKIRVAIIGCGSVSGVYLPHLSKSPYVELVSACDIKPDRAAKRATEFNIPNQYPHIDKLLAGAPFDLMIDTTNMQEHGRLNKQAILAGKHVWSEKPMANTYKEGKELYDLAKSKGVRIWGAPAVVNSPQFGGIEAGVFDEEIVLASFQGVEHLEEAFELLWCGDMLALKTDILDA